MYQPSERRYEGMEYKRCGRSGLKLPAMSLGLWQNFGTEKTLKEQEEILCHAFDRGITHFDLANNYGHPARGLAEENFGRALKDCLGPYRDELAVSTKAGYDMWQGPYGNWGSRKYLMGQPGSELKAHGPGLRGYFLPSPAGSGNAPGRDHGGLKRYGAPGKGSVRGNLQL